MEMQELAYYVEMAFKENPVKDLARKVISDGYSETEINILLTDKIEDSQRITFLNYIRDIKREGK